MAPLIRTSLAPSAQTPILTMRARHRQKVSIAAALFRSPVTGHGRIAHELFIDHYVDDYLYAEFLREHVLRGSRRPLLLLHDSAPMHRGQWTQEILEDSYPRLQAFELPAYAPELNPAEQLWNWSKDKKLANFVPDDLGQLAATADHVIQLAKSNQQRIQSFFEAAALPW